MEQYRRAHGQCVDVGGWPRCTALRWRLLCAPRCRGARRAPVPGLELPHQGADHLDRPSVAHSAAGLGFSERQGGSDRVFSQGARGRCLPARCPSDHQAGSAIPLACLAGASRRRADARTGRSPQGARRPVGQARHRRNPAAHRTRHGQGAGRREGRRPRRCGCRWRQDRRRAHGAHRCRAGVGGPSHRRFEPDARPGHGHLLPDGRRARRPAQLRRVDRQAARHVGGGGGIGPAGKRKRPAHHHRFGGRNRTVRRPGHGRARQDLQRPPGVPGRVQGRRPGAATACFPRTGPRRKI